MDALGIGAEDRQLVNLDALPQLAAVTKSGTNAKEGEGSGGWHRGELK
jgi:hypothetical protein